MISDEVFAIVAIVRCARMRSWVIQVSEPYLSAMNWIERERFRRGLDQAAQANYSEGIYVNQGKNNVHAARKKSDIWWQTNVYLWTGSVTLKEICYLVNEINVRQIAWRFT